MKLIRTKPRQSSVAPNPIASVTDNNMNNANPKVQKSRFHPRPSPSVHPEDWLIPSDDDVWVEGSYKTTTGEIVVYYRSLRTGVCQLFEPPTGAAFVLHQHELEYQRADVQAFARQRLSKDVLCQMRPPKPILTNEHKNICKRRRWRMFRRGCV